jgi:hypothetical protein
MDFQMLSYNDHTLFHMLRHFEYVNELARICLNERGYSNDIIEEHLSMSGSKFHKGFTSDIKTLAERLKLGSIIEIRERKKYLELILNFNETDFPEGIGTLGVCNRTQLETLDASIPFLKTNRGLQLWHARVAQMPTTHQITIVVKKQSSSYFLITAFPGLPTIPLPQKKMTSSELALSKEYWADKVFIEN